MTMFFIQGLWFPLFALHAGFKLFLNYMGEVYIFHPGVVYYTIKHNTVVYDVSACYV